MEYTYCMKKTFFLVLIFLLCSPIFAQKVNNTETELHEASFWHILDEKQKTVQCELCPREFIIPINQTGYCTVRINKGGTLYTISYNHPVSLAVDPIEKKPVFHMLPGTKSFSLATAGCNMRCIHCQNWEISQQPPQKVKSYYLTPIQIVNMAKDSNSKSISYTYTEPVIFYEYMLDIAKLAKKDGLKNIMVTSGYINQQPLEELVKYIDVFRVDLKGFTEDFYKKIASAKLQPVLSNLKYLKQKGAHIEIINLVIPTLNDNPKDIKNMCLWIKENLGEETPLFFSRFYPMHKLTNLPPTPIQTLEMARKIATECGLKYVYIGNVPGHPAENTYCPKCGKTLVGRVGYSITENNIRKSRCKFCNYKIYGIWE